MHWMMLPTSKSIEPLLKRLKNIRENVPQSYIQKRCKSSRNIAAFVRPPHLPGIAMDIFKGDPIIPLTIPLKESGGRNNTGRITVRHRGGGDKKVYRMIDYNRTLRNVPGKVVRFETDPNRTAPISLIAYENGELGYMITPKGQKVGDEVISSVNAPLQTGNHVPLGMVPISTFVHNLEFNPYKGGAIARGGGSFGMIVKKSEDYVTVKLKKVVKQECLIGDVGVQLG